MVMKGAGKKSRGRGRKSRRHARKSCKRGGGALGGVVSALKTALPSIVLYEALRMQGKRTKSRKSSARKTRRRRR
jgi:hypothetical protein